ncbi:uncharacterized protein A4U43_C02F80 [Asparagus officinalis]|uniref:Uncharacterized protein n=1 Tax=Asparagus officinalis TaxID=4686 RepID=A0A5P1FJI0_ASPOF|nr:uncharacterized protein A4U43_C02F80 [Asparagus officinalis]
MVIEPAVLIVGNEQRSLIPLRAGPQRLINLLDKPLTSSYVVGRVVVIGGVEIQVKVLLLDDSVVGQFPGAGVALEGELVVVEVNYVLELAKALEEEDGGDILVVDAEAEAVLLERIKDGLLGEAVDEVPADVAGGAVGR